jgi:drug/metabolite transporter (DMT)-like permease
MRLSIPKEHQLIGQLAVFGAAFLWSTSGLFIKLIDWNPIVIAGTRSFVAAVFLLIVRLISPPPKGLKTPAFPFWANAFTLAFTVLTFVTANKLTTAANVILLQYSAPVWAALLGWWLAKEKPRWEHWGALFFVMAGLMLFFRDGIGGGAFLGNIVSVISGMFLGAQTVFLRMTKDGDPRDSMLMGHVITAVISIPFIFLYPPTLTTSTVLPLLYMGFLQMGLASLLLSYGIKRITAIQAILTAVVDPILNPVWVLLITGERPSPAALAGGAIILGAVVASSIIGIRRVERSK